MTSLEETASRFVRWLDFGGLVDLCLRGRAKRKRSKAAADRAAGFDVASRLTAVVAGMCLGWGSRRRVSPLATPRHVIRGVDLHDQVGRTAAKSTMRPCTTTCR